MCIPTKIDSRSNPLLLEFDLDTSIMNDDSSRHDVAVDHQPSQVDWKREEEEHVTNGRFIKIFCVFFCCFVLSLSIRLKHESNNLKLEHDRIKKRIRDIQSERRNRIKQRERGGLEYTQQPMIENWWENENVAMLTITTN